jgi:hypothetical protein
VKYKQEIANMVSIVMESRYPCGNFHFILHGGRFSPVLAFIVEHIRLALYHSLFKVQIISLQKLLFHDDTDDEGIR